MFDMKMRQENRHVCLMMDNFPGHNISYVPRNVQLKYFEPNMTPFVQPLDAGIIRCFKAHYRRAFCLRAIELDEAGEREIYKISLQEAMVMVRNAWNVIEPITITNCWKHTKIQGQVNLKSLIWKATHGHHRNGSTTTTEAMKSGSTTLPPTAIADPAAWEIVKEFAAANNISLPQAENNLKAYLGSHYHYEEWKTAFDVVLEAEDNTNTAIQNVNALATIALTARIPTTNPSTPSISTRITSSSASTPQLTSLETDLMETVTELKSRRRIIGTAPTLEDLLNPAEENDVGDSPY